MINSHLPECFHQFSLCSTFLGFARVLLLRFKTPKKSVVKLRYFLTTFKKNTTIFLTEKTSALLYMNLTHLISNIHLRTISSMFVYFTQHNNLRNVTYYNSIFNNFNLFWARQRQCGTSQLTPSWLKLFFSEYSWYFPQVWLVVNDKFENLSFFSHQVNTFNCEFLHSQ